MLKIFQTGDNHIGLKYANRENKSKFAKCRIEAFENMVKAANQEKCSLFVIIILAARYYTQYIGLFSWDSLEPLGYSWTTLWFYPDMERPGLLQKSRLTKYPVLIRQ